MGDFVKGNPEGRFPEEIVEGIMNHRRIDYFTDSNAVVALSKRIISKQRCRFSGVIIDIFYDHFLSRNWGLYSIPRLGIPSRRGEESGCSRLALTNRVSASAVPGGRVVRGSLRLLSEGAPQTGLNEFIETVYNNLGSHDVSIPHPAEIVIQKIIQEDWLRSYGSLEGMDKAFKRLSGRMRGEENLCSSVEELVVHYCELNAHFLRFFPLLLSYLDRGSLGDEKKAGSKRAGQ